MDDRYADSNEKQKDRILRAAFGDEAKKEENRESLDYVYELMEQDILDEYLVNGARLTCEKATAAPIVIDNQCFFADICGKGTQTPLSVNRRMKLYDLPFANLSDTKKGVNIFPFGNCTCELTEAEKQYLKGIPEAKTEGICKYLMRLNESWDIFPRLEGRNYIEGYPAIDMRARLFCHSKGAFIYPVTSGQRSVMYGYEDTPLFAMDIDEAIFAAKHNLTEEQMVIFLKIQQYFDADSKLEQGNVIFAFEGLGSFSGPSNSDHPNGQFGAIFILYQDGKPQYMSDKCSTLPDNVGPATIEDGVYYAVYHMHGNEDYRYQALQLWTDETNSCISAHYHDGGANVRDAKGINLHTAGNLKDHAAKPWSKGCLTISVTDYYDFGVEAGFIIPRTGDYTNYQNIKKLSNIDPKLPMGKQWGYIVVNRDCMEVTEKSKFLYEDDSHEIN